MTEFVQRYYTKNTKITSFKILRQVCHHNINCGRMKSLPFRKNLRTRLVAQVSSNHPPDDTLPQKGQQPYFLQHSWCSVEPSRWTQHPQALHLFVWVRTPPKEVKKIIKNLSKIISLDIISLTNANTYFQFTK